MASTPCRFILRKPISLVLPILAVIILAAGCAQDRTYGTIVVDTGPHERIDTPVEMPLDAADLVPSLAATADEAAQLLASAPISLTEQGGRRVTLPAQWVPAVGFPWESEDRAGSLVWILEGTTPEETTRTFDLEIGDNAQGEAYAVIDRDSTYVQMEHGGSPVLRYNYGVVREDSGERGPYDRAAYVHPVWTPSGEVITGDFSPEHIHQRGLFFAWRDVAFDSVVTDFWGLGASAARVVPAAGVPHVWNGPVCTAVLARNNGLVGDRIYTKENHRVRLYKILNLNGWLFDLKVRQVPVDPAAPNQQPGDSIRMIIPELYYGGMSFRGTSRWLRESARDVQRVREEGITFPADFSFMHPEDSLVVLTSRGDGRYDGDGTRVHWLDYSGPLDDVWGGIVGIDHPANPRHPTPVRVHPELPYFSFAMVREAPYTVTGSEPLELRYRFFVHSGRPDSLRAERLSADFTSPPQARWEPAP